MLCYEPFPGELKCTILLISYREPTTDQTLDTTKAQLGEPVRFFGVTYRSRYESNTAASARYTHMCMQHAHTHTQHA